MPISLTIDIRDAVTPQLRRLGLAVTSPPFRRALGAGVRVTLIKHFTDRQASKPNKQGWPRQGYWAGAARSVTQPVDQGAAVVVGIKQIGIAQHYYGNPDLRPKHAKFLTIPAVPEAYGTRARDARWVGRLQFSLVGGRHTALVARENFYRTVTKGKKAGQRQFATGSRARRGFAEVIFWLRRHVKIDPDPTVLPAESALTTAALESATRYVDAQLTRR